MNEEEEERSPKQQQVVDVVFAAICRRRRRQRVVLGTVWSCLCGMRVRMYAWLFECARSSCLGRPIGPE